MNNKTEMITGAPVGEVLFRLAAPMIFGILGMSVFNLMDTFFVGRLGTVGLAALSFTFPVVMSVSSIAHGLGVGMTAAVSKAAGHNDRKKLEEIISWGLLLSVVIVILVVTAGLLTIRPLFTALGADAETLEVITEYMRIWYIGAAFVVIPMVGNSAIRGMGDTRIPSLVMLTAAVINTILDPLLIFGLGPFPRLGVTGAAAATVFGRFTTFIVALWVLAGREKVLKFRGSSITAAFRVWKEILHVGIPNALAKLILPLGTAFITGMVASYGREAVAGFGVAGKLEMFALMPLMALTSILPVFIGQNFGAGKKDRVIRALSVSLLFAAVYCAVLYIGFIFGGRFFAGLFNSSTGVVEVAGLYLLIVPAAYCFRAMMDLSATTLSVTGKPVHSAVISIVQMFVIYIPLAILGSRIIGVGGIFGASCRLAAYDGDRLLLPDKVLCCKTCWKRKKRLNAENQ